MKYQYQVANTRNLEGLKEAEYLQAHGWKIISTGLFLIHFEREVK